MVSNEKHHKTFKTKAIRFVSNITLARFFIAILNSILTEKTKKDGSIVEVIDYRALAKVFGFAVAFIYIFIIIGYCCVYPDKTQKDLSNILELKNFIVELCGGSLFFIGFDAKNNNNQTDN